jgi:hypothetical protein
MLHMLPTIRAGYTSEAASVAPWRKAIRLLRSRALKKGGLIASARSQLQRVPQQEQVACERCLCNTAA